MEQRLYQGRTNIASRSNQGYAKVTLQLYHDYTKEVSRLYQGSTKVLSRRYQGSTKVEPRFYRGCIKVPKDQCCIYSTYRNLRDLVFRKAVPGRDFSLFLLRALQEQEGNINNGHIAWFEVRTTQQHI